MSDPTPRRRLAGRALLGAGLLALPLTASISYAASEAQDGVEVPAPPAPPAPPSPPLAPEAPAAPEAPEPPEAPTIIMLERQIERGGADEGAGEEVGEQVWRDAGGKERRFRMVFRGSPEGEAFARRFESVEGMDKAEREEMLAELRAELAEADKVLADLPRTIAEALAEAEAARASAPRVMMLKSCTDSFKGESEVIEGKDGKRIVMICQPRIAASARKGLEEAREEIARDRNIPEETRKQVLETLDRQIERWSSKEG